MECDKRLPCCERERRSPIARGLVGGAIRHRLDAQPPVAEAAPFRRHAPQPLALALEAYTSKSASVIKDLQNSEASDGLVGQPHSNIAELAAYPADLDWKAFGVGPATEAMSFRIEVDFVRDQISDLWRIAEDGVESAVCEQSAKLGLKALNLAVKFRRSRGLGSVDYSDEWSLKHYLEREAEVHAERNRKREAWEEAAGAGNSG